MFLPITTTMRPLTYEVDAASRFSAITSQIADQGWAIAERFLPDEAIRALALESQTLWSSGKFREAGIGRGIDYRVRPDVRGDRIFWLDEDDLTPVQKRYWDEIERLRLELNRELFIGLTRFEAHYSVFPPGTFYKRHIDRFSTSDDRAISCILYLNLTWREDDGGQLRIYTGQGDPDEFIDIYPFSGVLVVLRSDIIYHEVLPACKERFSLTGWLKRRPLKAHL